MLELFLPLPQLLSPDPSYGFSHGQSQRTDLFCQRGSHRPGCWDTVPLRQRGVAQPHHQPPDHDHHKLCALTDPHLWFAYRTGVLLVLGRKSVVSEVYVGGVPDQVLSDWLAGRLTEAALW